MDTLNLRFVFDRKKTANNTDSKGVLEIYAYDTVTKNKTYLSTHIELYKNEYSVKGNKIIKHPNAVSLNGRANRMFRDVEAFALSNKCKSIKDLKFWDTMEEQTMSVITFIESELKRRNPSMSVLSQNKALINMIDSFGMLKTFSDFTYANILEFDDHLRANGLAQPTAYKRHSLLHGYIKEAINRGYCSYDPYITFKPKKGKSADPTYLDEEELEILKNYDLSKETESDSLTRVKDLFVFQCFTGLAYVDLMSFKQEDISELDGYKVIRSNRRKTEQAFITVLLPDAINILEKYDYQLPKISNQKYNAYLKLVGLYVKDGNNKRAITKKLTTHVARHTYGTYLVNKGVPYETVARTMGHSNTKMTKHYAKMLGKTVVNDIAKFVIKKEQSND